MLKLKTIVCCSIRQLWLKNIHEAHYFVMCLITYDRSKCSLQTLITCLLVCHCVGLCRIGGQYSHIDSDAGLLHQSLC